LFGIPGANLHEASFISKDFALHFLSAEFGKAIAYHVDFKHVACFATAMQHEILQRFQYG
jgi:hypothetical protein